jgi:hypothetical protein
LIDLHLQSQASLEEIITLVRMMTNWKMELENVDMFVIALYSKDVLVT